ncbi:TerB family tellurite resistance protein [uncultured Shimia sp.]|uniref:tellurite resistance TerB family protein n=1 Tax=uncultured Shimia sp. TaxID=573152 RepID=UPI002619CFF5|nr:TerB family tellurite resistance protein [uncultured Shimia sp.]
MRILLIGCLTFFTIILTSQTAEARRGGNNSGHYETLTFVSETAIVREAEGPMALCHLTRKRYIAFIDYWVSSKGYVLAANNCNVESFYKVTADDVLMAQSIGMIPDSIPAEASMSISEFAKGSWGAALAILLAVLVGIKLYRQAMRKRGRKGEMGNISPQASAFLDAICHAAKADGDIDPSEIQVISEIASQATGQNFGPAQIKRIIQQAERNLTDAQYRSFGKDLSRHQKLMLVEAVLATVTADGKITKDEHTFLSKLAGALGVTGAEVSAMLPQRAPAPA